MPVTTVSYIGSIAISLSKLFPVYVVLSKFFSTASHKFFSLFATDPHFKVVYSFANVHAPCQLYIKQTTGHVV